MAARGSSLLVYCQGPVVNWLTRVKAQDAGIPPGDEDLNFWGHSLSIAGALLQFPEYIVMGGRTGGQEYASEAELLHNQLVAYGVPSEVIKLEQSSTNTLENIVNFMDLYLGEDPEREFDLLGTNYHIDRIQLLMDLFGIAWGKGYGSHSVIRADVDAGVVPQEMLVVIEALSLLEVPLVRIPDTTGFYERQLGVEKKTFAERAHEEDAFTRMLLEVPSYWMTYLGRIKSDLLLSRVLRNVEWIFPGYLESQGIDSGSADHDAMEFARKKLGLIERPNIARWIIEEMPKGLPLDTREKLEKIARWRHLNRQARRAD